MNYAFIDPHLVKKPEVMSRIRNVLEKNSLRGAVPIEMEETPGFCYFVDFSDMDSIISAIKSVGCDLLPYTLKTLLFNSVDSTVEAFEYSDARLNAFLFFFEENTTSFEGEDEFFESFDKKTHPLVKLIKLKKKYGHDYVLIGKVFDLLAKNPYSIFITKRKVIFDALKPRYRRKRIFLINKSFGKKLLRLI